MPSVTAMGMASSAALTRMRIVMAGENEGRNERLNRRAADGERASVVEGRWNGAAEQDLAMVFVGIVGGERLQAFSRKERRIRRQSVSQRYEAASYRYQPMYMYRVPGAHVHQVRCWYEREQPSRRRCAASCSAH